MHIFLSILGLYLFLNAWIAYWLWRALRGGNKVLRVVISLLFVILSIGFLLVFRGDKQTWLSMVLLKPCAFWLGTFHYTFILVLIAQVVAWWRRKRSKKMFDVGPHPQYRTVFCVFFFSAIISLLGSINANDVKVKTVNITVSTDKKGYKNLPEKMVTIALVTDLHLGRLIPVDTLEYCVELLKPYKPDVLLFAGDVLDDHAGLDPAKMKEIISGFQPRMGTWACLGNHEYHSGPVADSIKILEESGIKVLRDDYTVLQDSILLVGRDDLSGARIGGRGGDRKSLPDILENTGGQAERLPIILMDHQPLKLEAAEEAGVALQVSGHTHYGQVWPGNIIVSYLYENARGHSVRGNTHYYVSSGAGTWGPPIRNTSRAEVVIIKLRFTEANSKD